MKIRLIFLFMNILSSSITRTKLKEAENIIKDLLHPRKLDTAQQSSLISQNPLSAYTLEFSSQLPPPPPTYAQGSMPVNALSHEIVYPAQVDPAWKMNNYPQIYNPYYGHLWAHHPLHQTAYEYMPFGLHPFMFPSMGAYGLNPLGAMNPMFGSINPFMNTHSALMGLNQQNLPTSNPELTNPQMQQSLQEDNSFQNNIEDKVTTKKTI